MRVLAEIRQYLDLVNELLSGELEAEHRRVMEEFNRSLADLKAAVSERTRQVPAAACRFRPPKPRPLKTGKPGRSPDADTVGTVRNQRSPGPFVHSVPRGSSGKRRG